jgi:hypothetical protein
MTRQLISTFRQPPLRYLTRSVRPTSGFVLADREVTKKEHPGRWPWRLQLGLFGRQVSGAASHPAAVLEEVIADTHPVFLQMIAWIAGGSVFGERSQCPDF